MMNPKPFGWQFLWLPDADLSSNNHPRCILRVLQRISTGEVLGHVEVWVLRLVFDDTLENSLHKLKHLCVFDWIATPDDKSQQ